MLLGGFDGQTAVRLRWDPHDEPSGVVALRERLGDGLSCLLKVSKDICDEGKGTLECCGRCVGEPGERRQLGDGRDVLTVLGGVADAIGVLLGVQQWPPSVSLSIAARTWCNLVGLGLAVVVLDVDAWVASPRSAEDGVRP